MTKNEQRAERGREAVHRHPDYRVGSFETYALDTIADVLHACERFGGMLPSEAHEWVERALRVYEGDAEDEEVAT